MGIVVFTISLVACLTMRLVASNNTLSSHLKNMHKLDDLDKLIKINMKAEINPCEDFYKHICGKWMETAVPYGVVTWTQTEERTISMKAKVAEYLRRKVNAKYIYPIRWAINHFKKCMNESALNEIGEHPLANIVNSVGSGGWNILAENPGNAWMAVHNSYSQITGKGALFNIEVGPDENLDRNVLIISPTEQLFLRDNSMSNRDNRSQYEEFLTAIWTAYPKQWGHPIHSPRAVKNAIEAVLSFRGEIIEERNHIRRAPKMTAMTISELEVHTRSHMLVKDLNWLHFLRSTFKNVGNFTFNGSTVVHIRQLDYLNIILKAIEGASEGVLLNHIHFHFMERFVQYTSVGMTTLFYHVLNRPLPKRSITCVSGNPMKKIMNYIYVKKFLTNKVMYNATLTARNVQETLKSEILHTKWMEGKTARIAIHKLEEIKYVIGYDDWYQNEKNLIDYYTKMAITKDYFNTILDFETMTYKIALRKLWRPVTNKFNRTPPDPFDVDAVYNYQTNTLVIPAALLQVPLSRSSLLSTTCGGLGTIVGHALSRSFDSLGRQYDEKGNRTNWWGDNSQKEYNKRLQCYAKIFKKEFVREFPTSKVNFSVDGNNYMDEIVAEYMGLVAAYKAYRKRIRSFAKLRRHGRQSEEINSDRLFFIAYATRHCEAVDTDFLNLMGINARLPYRLRVNTALSNMQAFADTFNCKENDPMSSLEKCEWLGESGPPNQKQKNPGIAINIVPPLR